MRIAAHVAILFLCAANAFAQPCAVTKFESVPAHYAGPEPRTFVLANLDGDEWPDAIVGSYDQNPSTSPIGGLAILRGHRGGNWSVITELERGEQVSHVAAVDFDGDGDDDIAYFVTTTDVREIRVLRNERPGFTRVSAYEAPGHPLGGLAAGDFNGDHREDLVFTMFAEASLLLMSRGDGTFTISQLASATIAAPAVADLNADGFDDLVISNTGTQSVALYRGSANGLQALAPVALNETAADLAIGRFDANGTLDVVVTLQGRVTFDTIYDAARDTQNVTASSTLLHVNDLDRPAAGDLDGNGIDDLIWFDWRGVEAALFRAGRAPLAGDNWFVPGRQDSAYWDHSIATADLDRDGDLDVVVVTADGLRTLFNDGEGAFGTPRFATRVRATGDFNGDGRDDLVDSANVLLAGPNGEFESIPQRTAYADQDVIRTAVADVDGDGHLDAVWLRELDRSGYVTYRVVVRLGNGDGTLRPAQELALERTPQHMLVRDFTGDGRADLLITNDVWLASLFVSNGDGTFAAEQTIEDARGRNLEAGDVDGDGDLDLVGDYTHINDGAGHFTRLGQAGSGLLFDPLLGLGDLNGDGLDDITVALSGQEVRVFLSVAGDEPQYLDTLLTGLGDVGDLDVRDFNGDGHADLLVTEDRTTAATGYLMLYYGDGTGNFPRKVRMRSASWEAAVGDFNGDGLPDLADAGHIRLASCAQPKQRSARH